MKIPKKLFGVPLLFVIIGVIAIYFLFIKKKTKTTTVLANSETVTVKTPASSKLTKSPMTIKKALSSEQFK